jgi:photosystem II stability/assembly factor-like uncharacterized protein
VQKQPGASSVDVSWARVRNARTIVSALFLLGALAASNCTFYTGTPNGTGNAAPMSNTTSGAANSSGGTGAAASGGSDTAMGGEAGVEIGADGGVVRKWVNATGSLGGRISQSGDVWYLSAKPDEDMLIAGLSGFGLWASTDGGETWHALGASSDSDVITQIETEVVYDPAHSNVFWEAGIYGVNGALYRTDDDGVTIKQVGSVTHINTVSVDFTDSKRMTLLAGPHESSQKLYLSTDAGMNWDTIGQNLPDGSGFSSYPLVLDAQTFLVGCTNSIARSDDGGATWTKVSSFGGAGVPVTTPDGSIFWGSDPDVGLLHSADQGLTWDRVVGAGILQTSVTLALPDGRLASLTAPSNVAPNTYVAVSADGGVSWKVASPPLPIAPLGLVYSAQRKAFYIWMTSTEPQIPADSIVRFDWDYQTE